jgi:hypothetical protein
MHQAGLGLCRVLRYIKEYHIALKEKPTDDPKTDRGA